MPNRTARWLPGCLAVISCLTLGAADETAVAGRKILEENRLAVVTVELVIRSQVSMRGRGSQEFESKSEATGVVIDPSGLTVMSLSKIDPAAAFGGGRPGFEMDSEVQDIKILLLNGEDLSAEVVLRDPDLDLAFIRPVKKPAKPLDAVDLSKSAEVEVLDQVISLNRLGRVARRVHSASLERIDAVVEKPRRFYIPGADNTTTDLGSPAFALDGRVVGIFVMRTINPPKGAGQGLIGGPDPFMSVILLPAKDIAEAAEQAPAPK